MKNKFARLASIALVTVFAGFSSVQAATIDTLFNTGVDDSGNVLSVQEAEIHYTLTSAPSGITGNTLMTIGEAGGYPVGPWIGDNNNSRWIVPTADRTWLDYPAGEYIFTTTFDLTGLDPATAEINGKWAADNNGTDIILNGNHLNISTDNAYSDWTEFVINSGFVEGTNTLQFVVSNSAPTTGGENVIGLRVEMTGTATVVPVPAAVWLFGSGLLGLMGYSRRKTA
jgi:hypothetical protein